MNHQGYFKRGILVVATVGIGILLICEVARSENIHYRRGVVRSFGVPGNAQQQQVLPYYYPDEEFEPTESPSWEPPVEQAQATIFGSVWAAWTHWSTCHENQRIRVRACNTIRGFRCFGTNREARWCQPRPPPIPPPTPPPAQQNENIQIDEDGSIIEFFVPIAPIDPAQQNVYDPLPYVEYEAYDPWEADRRLAMWQLYGIPLPRWMQRPTPPPLPVPKLPASNAIPRSNKTIEDQTLAREPPTTPPTKGFPPTAQPNTAQNLETFEPLEVFTRQPFKVEDRDLSLKNLKTANKPANKAPSVLRYGSGYERVLHEKEVPVVRASKIREEQQGRLPSQRRQQTVKIDGNTFMIIVPPVENDLPETLLGFQNPIESQPVVPQPVRPVKEEPSAAPVVATKISDEIRGLNQMKNESGEQIGSSDTFSNGLSSDEFEQIQNKSIETKIQPVVDTGSQDPLGFKFHAETLPEAPPPVVLEESSLVVDTKPVGPDRSNKSSLNDEKKEKVEVAKLEFGAQGSNRPRARPPGFSPDPFSGVETGTLINPQVVPTLISFGSSNGRTIAKQSARPFRPPPLTPQKPPGSFERELPVPGGYGSIGQPPPFSFWSNGDENAELQDPLGAAVVIGPVIYAEANRYQDGPQFQPLSPSVPQGFAQRNVKPAAEKLSVQNAQTEIWADELEKVEEVNTSVEKLVAIEELRVTKPGPPSIRPPHDFEHKPVVAVKLSAPSIESSVISSPQSPQGPIRQSSITRVQDAAKWSEWSDWGVCKCGTRSRTRSCLYISSHFMQGCSGPSYEIESCEGTFCDRKPSPPGNPVPIVPPNVRKRLQNSVPPGGIFLAGQPALRVEGPPGSRLGLPIGTQLRGLGVDIGSHEWQGTRINMHGSSVEKLDDRDSRRRRA